MHATHERIAVAGPEVVGVRLTAAACAHGLALPEALVVARPTGVGRAGSGLSTEKLNYAGRASGRLVVMAQADE